MKRVTGLGGIFFKSDDPERLRSWYEKYLGIKSSNGGAMFEWRDRDNPDQLGVSVWSVFKRDTKYFNPSGANFMMNFRVANLIELLKELRKEGVTVIGEPEEYEYGKFGWIMDPDGNKIELWEPPDSVKP